MPQAVGTCFCGGSLIAIESFIVGFRRSVMSCINQRVVNRQKLHVAPRLGTWPLWTAISVEKPTQTISFFFSILSLFCYKLDYDNNIDGFTYKPDKSRLLHN